MAKSEILMWVAGILMMVILGLAVAPTITKSGDTAKMAVINSEIGNIRKASILYYSNNATVGFTSVTAEILQPYIPSLTLDGSTPKLFISKANAGIKYKCEVGADTSLMKVTITGLTTITGAEKNVKTSQSTQATTTVDTVVDTDGILIFEFKG